ncbi:Transducin beta-like protein 3 [Glycine soja]|uniref:Transducin beta-like protein 3 n=1 Tax=Glycine soja TaxID=3848 RepID=A0A445HN92_GLYSO|nr:Transducin beta-like protein 3 [Glycine soja]
MDGLSDNMTMPINLKAKVVVAAHDKDINSVVVAPNDSLVCSGSQDHTTCVWRLPDLVSVVVFKGHKRGIWSVEFSPVDQCVVTASGDKTIRIWAIYDGSCLKTFKGHTSSVLRALFVTRGTQIVSCGMRLSEEGVVKGQELENVVSDADYTKAIQIAFELRRPHRLFELFAELCRKRVAENHMDRALKGLGGEELCILFNYI